GLSRSHDVAFAVAVAFAFNGCDQAPLRGQQPKASGFAGGSLLEWTNFSHPSRKQRGEDGAPECNAYGSDQ
ncbi:MAG: hypothetical protein ACYDC6_11235, partial [Acidobacteriaceae bacterium]